MTNVIFNSGFIGFLICVLLFAVSTATLPIAIRCVWGIAKIYICDGGIRRKADSVSFPLHRADGLTSSSARPGGIAERASDCTDEVLHGSLPDAFGRPVDYCGGGRRLERAEQKTERIREQ